MDESSLLSFWPNQAYKRDFSEKIYGVWIGVVTDNVHPEGDYRVRVKFPQMPGGGMSDSKDQSWWARIATMMSGPDRGSFWLPEKDDEVLVAFLNGEFNQPIVIGNLWNGKDKPTYSNKDASGKVTWPGFIGPHDAKKNDLRHMTSRKFHQLIFNDNKGDPRVVLHSSQKHRIVLDDKGNEANKIEIYDGKEENYILIDTKNKKITIETKTGDMLLKAKNLLRIECKTLETKSDQNTKMEVGQDYDVKVSGKMTEKITGTANIESNGNMTIKGAKVLIN